MLEAMKKKFMKPKSIYDFCKYIGTVIGIDGCVMCVWNT